MRYPGLLKSFIFMKGLLKTLDSYSKSVVIVFGNVSVPSYLYVEKRNLKTIQVKIQYSYC